MISEILSVGKGALGLAKNSPWTLGILLAIVTAVIGFVEYRLHAEYERGKAETLVKISQEYEEKRKEQAKIDAAALIKAKEAHDLQKEIAIELAKKLAKKPKVTIREITKATSTPNCRKLCPDNYELWLDISQKPAGIEYRSQQGN